MKERISCRSFRNKIINTFFVNIDNFQFLIWFYNVFNLTSSLPVGSLAVLAFIGSGNMLFFK